MRLLRHRASRRPRQRGATAVELALILAFVFLPLLLGILEFGRMFYVFNMSQEVTRRAARAQVARWSSETADIRRDAVLQCGDRNGLARASLDCRNTASTVKLPAGPEIGNAQVELAFFHSYEDALGGNNAITSQTSPQSNLNTCLLDASDGSCIRYVRATLQPITYQPMIGWFGDLFAISLPSATVIMPAEGLGLR